MQYYYSIKFVQFILYYALKQRLVESLKAINKCLNNNIVVLYMELKNLNEGKHQTLQERSKNPTCHISLAV